MALDLIFPKEGQVHNISVLGVAILILFIVDDAEKLHVTKAAVRILPVHTVVIAEKSQEPFLVMI